MTQTTDVSLLALNFSPRGSASVTRELASRFVAAWAQAGADRQVLVRDADQLDGPWPDSAWIEANGIADGARSEAQRTLLAASDAEIERIQNASHLVLSAPMHNFSVPWRLKAYIDTLVRAGKTFGVAADGRFVPVLRPGKKLLLITSSAGSYDSGGPLADMDHLTPYVKAVFGFMGVRTFECVTAGGMWGGTDLAQEAVRRAHQRLDEMARRW